MRLLFILVAATLISAWYAWFIVRPRDAVKAKQILMVSGIVAVLILAGFLRLI